MIVNRHKLFLGSSYQTYSTHNFLIDFPVNVKIKTEAQTEHTHVFSLMAFLCSTCYCTVHISCVHFNGSNKVTGTNNVAVM